MTTKNQPKKTLTVTKFIKLYDKKVDENLKGRLKSQNKIKRAIHKAIKEIPKTVPEISLETNISSYDLLWYISTSLRYIEVEAVEKTEENYWKYKLITKENK
jgi:hypothetical protein